MAIALKWFRRTRVAGYVDLDRFERRIQQQMLIALIAGVLLGAVVETLNLMLPNAVYVVLDPYAFFVLVLAMGRIGLGFGWALANSALATCGTLLSELVGSEMVRGESPLSIGQSGPGLNTLLFLLILAGILAYCTRRRDLWGDVAAGALGAVLVANMAGDLGHWRDGGSFPGWQWSLCSSAALALACVLLLRPSLAGRTRAVVLGLLLVGPYLLFVM